MFSGASVCSDELARPREMVETKQVCDIDSTETDEPLLIYEARNHRGVSTLKLAHSLILDVEASA